MTKIMIVDDEAIVRECLRSTIDWSEIDCEIVAEAADGIEALEVYKSSLPDIVITDIVMTFSNGLDFIANVKAVNPNVEIIILSGYNDFEYAKKALENNVSAYLLKPINNDAIINEVLKIKSRLKEKQTSNHVRATANRDNFLLNLLSTEYLTAEQMENLCKTFDIVLPSDKYSVAVLQIDKMHSPNLSLALIRLKETLSYYISISKDYILTSTLNNEIVLLYVYSSSLCGTDVCDFLALVQNHYKNTFSHTVTIGVSGIFKNLTIVQRAYKQATAALEQKAAFGTNSIIKYTEISSNPQQSSVELTTDEMNEIIECVKSGNITQATQIINNYFTNISHLKSIDITLIKNRILELIVLLIHTMIKNSNMMYAVFNRNFFPAIEIQALEFILEIQEWTVDIITKLGECHDLCIPHSYSPALNKALLYIRANYSQKIKLEDVAKELFMSSRSLRRIFLAETGKSFQEHLTEYRIKMSVNLIENTSYKICDIANLVGYNDVKHFYRTFKKITGHNPKHYKRALKEEDI
ncbi:MAG: response regulator [Clostridia bacterium]|nr:response regulator [Clostridia bacterium]MBP3360092.1 response regulator [Clostridia bacterium]